LSDDGSAVVVAQRTGEPGRSPLIPNALPDIIHCWDVETGEKRWERRANAATRLEWVDGGRLIVSNESGTLNNGLLVWIDAATGKVIREVSLGGRAFHVGPLQLDPANRRLLIAMAEAERPNTLQLLAMSGPTRCSCSP